MKKLGLALCVLSSGCYLNHGVSDDAGRRDAGTDASAGACLTEGTYEVPARFVSASPAGCVDSTPTTVPMHIPPRPEDFAMMCGGEGARVIETASCAWSIRSECLIPDASTILSGNVDALGGAVHGRFEVVQSGFGGECRFSLILGD